MGRDPAVLELNPAGLAQNAGGDFRIPQRDEYATGPVQFTLGNPHCLLRFNGGLEKDRRCQIQDSTEWNQDSHRHNGASL